MPFYLDVLERGAYDFIVPPFAPADLAHIVKFDVDSALALRRARTQAAPKAPRFPAVAPAAAIRT